MAEANQNSGKGGLIRTIIMIVALVAVGGGGYFFRGMMPGSAPSAASEQEKAAAAEGDKKKEAEAKKKEALNKSYVTLEPFVVNLRHESRERLLRASIVLLVREKEQATLLEKNQPMLRNNLLLVFAAQDPQVLITPEGKTGLQKALLSEVKKTYGTLGGGSDDIEELFFTDFIMQ